MSKSADETATTLAKKLHAASCRFMSIKADWDGLTDRSKKHWIAIAQGFAAPDAQ